MHCQTCSVVFIVSCYLNSFSKVIYAYSNSDLFLKVPLQGKPLIETKQSPIERLKSELLKTFHTTSQIDSTHVDLRGLYATLKKHPKLMDRRLQVGSKTPPPLPDINDTPSFNKRSFDIGGAQPACPFRTQWVRLTQAMDINNTEVEVYQPTDDNSNRFQWFYTVTCDSSSLINENADCPLCCRAINRLRYTSQCVARKSYVMAFIRNSSNDDFDWGYIQVDSSCNCAISARN